MKLNKFKCLAVLLLLPALASAAADDPLPPAEAYRYTVDADASEIRVHWDVEPGYYLYRKRFSFKAGQPELTLGEPLYPRGELHNDEFFGEQEIYRGKFTILIPYQVAGGLTRADLSMRIQGCADIGLCYPPQDWTANVNLPAGGARPELPGKKPSLDALLGGSGGQALPGEQFLPPDQAFRFQVEPAAAGKLTVTWSIEPGYYLYKDKLAFRSDTPGIELGFPGLPPGKLKSDEYFGDTEVYYDHAEILLPYTSSLPDGSSLDLAITFQGCAEDGICYPPTTRSVVLGLQAADSMASTAAPGQLVSEQDRLATLIRDGNLLLVLGTFFGLGLLLAFTPCVLPMVPILSGIIVGQGEQVTTRRALSLSIAYVAGMALTYTIAGAAFAAVGQQAQAVFQKPWIIVLFSGLFVALALSMFGLYELQVPSALQTRLSSASNKQKSGSYLGTVVMGALSALIVSACVAPPLVAALAVIGQAGDVFRGGAALLALSLGMGAPLIVFGASAGKLLPRAGGWMEAVKMFFGYLLLGVALWMLDRVLPAWTVMLLWAILAIAFGLYLGALQTPPPGAGAGRQFGRGLGLASLTYGILLLVGLAGGKTDPLQPLAGLVSGGSGVEARQHLEFKRIKTVQDLEQELAIASAAGRPVMLDFYADWCVSCKEMERYTFTDSAVRAALGDAILLQADVTPNDEADQQLLKYFGIFGPPTIAFFASDGTERKNFRVVGFMPAEQFAAHVTDAFTKP